MHELAPCPKSPNCVSTQAGDTAHFIEPIRFSGSPESAWGSLRTVLASVKRLTVTEDTDSYLRAEARSLLFRFVDDVEFLLAFDEQVIHARSASRVGHTDLGVNRRRLEHIRQRFSEIDV